MSFACAIEHEIHASLQPSRQCGVGREGTDGLREHPQRVGHRQTYSFGTIIYGGYAWKRFVHTGMSASDLRRLKETEAELSQYKKMYAELAHENYALKDLIEKKL